MNSPKTAITCSLKSRWINGTQITNGNMSGFLFLAVFSYSFRANPVSCKNTIGAGGKMSIAVSKCSGVGHHLPLFSSSVSEEQALVKFNDEKLISGQTFRTRCRPLLHGITPLSPLSCSVRGPAAADCLPFPASVCVFVCMSALYGTGFPVSLQ